MAKVRRSRLPPALLSHLLDRIQQRRIDPEQLGFLADWLDTEPEVPPSRWFKRFPGMTVCGEGESLKTFLTPGQLLALPPWASSRHHEPTPFPIGCLAPAT
jgi:hypothetical protein